jgi:hydroxymethylglutaryl-CoA reductase
MWLLSLAVVLPTITRARDEVRKILKTKQQHYRVNRREIAFIKFIFEGYDGIVMMRTVNPVKGIIALHIPAGCEKHVNAILQDLKKNIKMQVLAPTPS